MLIHPEGDFRVMDETIETFLFHVMSHKLNNRTDGVGGWHECVKWEIRTDLIQNHRMSTRLFRLYHSPSHRHHPQRHTLSHSKIKSQLCDFQRVNSV